MSKKVLQINYKVHVSPEEYERGMRLMAVSSRSTRLGLESLVDERKQP
jgi:hypothetical protein